MSLLSLVSGILLTHLVQTVITQTPVCQIRNDSMIWRETPTIAEIHWSIDRVCQTSDECYGIAGYAKDLVQLCPVYVQHSDSVNITLPVSSLYSLRTARGKVFT